MVKNQKAIETIKSNIDRQQQAPNKPQKPTGDSVGQLIKYIDTVLDDIQQLKACRSRNPYVNKYIRIELAAAYNETKKCVEKILTGRPEIKDAPAESDDPEKYLRSAHTWCVGQLFWENGERIGAEKTADKPAEKSAGTEQDIKPVKESKSKSLSIECQSARTTALLCAAAQLKQIADNFESWAKKQLARFVDPDGVKPPAITLAQVEDWVNRYLLKQKLIAVFFDHPHLSYDKNSGLTPFFTTYEHKEFHLIIDVFRLHMPAIATSLKELYDEFWEDVAYRIECYKRSKKVRQREQQGDISPSTLIGETADDVSVESQPILFLDGTVARLIRRLRHIAEMTRENLAAEEPVETGRGAEPKGKRKRGRKKDPKVRTRNKEIAKYRARNPRLTWKEIGSNFGVSGDIARKACNNPDN